MRRRSCLLAAAASACDGDEYFYQLPVFCAGVLVGRSRTVHMLKQPKHGGLLPAMILRGCDVHLCACMQAEDRAHRIGQKKAVLVLILVAAGTIEQAILDRAQAKRDIDAKVIQVRGLLQSSLGRCFFARVCATLPDCTLPI